MTLYILYKEDSTLNCVVLRLQDLVTTRLSTLVSVLVTTQTGFPLRQEVVLSDKQDFYAQAKREDAGIVFYTGLNSNGDLYIGNRKINAITGEETFLERAALADSGDDSDSIGALVTTFDNAVTFNDKVTIEGETFMNNPVQINVDPLDGDSLPYPISNTVWRRSG